MDEDRYEMFLKELSELTKKYNIEINGCAQHETPFLKDTKSGFYVGESLEYDPDVGKYFCDFVWDDLKQRKV